MKKRKYSYLFLIKLPNNINIAHVSSKDVDSIFSLFHKNPILNSTANRLRDFDII